VVYKPIIKNNINYKLLEVIMDSINFCCGEGWIFPIVMMVFCVLMCIFFFRCRHFWSHCSPSKWDYRPWGSKNDETSLELLKKRYAKGEIKKDEFEQIKKDIIQI
jgi:putative membrane protein